MTGAEITRHCSAPGAGSTKAERGIGELLPSRRRICCITRAAPFTRRPSLRRLPIREEDQYRLERAGLLALREYVPGSQLLVVGRLVTSRGLLKHWTGAELDNYIGLRGNYAESLPMMKREMIPTSTWAGLLGGSGLEVACMANFRVADNFLGLLLRSGPRPGEFRLTSQSMS
jgi:hypothetical protein